MIEIQTNLCNECMSTVLMLTLLDPTLAYYTWVKTREPWEYDYSIAFHTKSRHNISYTSITIIMKSISQQTQNDIISLLEQGKSCRQIGQEIGVHYSTVSKFHLKLNFTPPKGKGGCPSKLTPLQSIMPSASSALGRLITVKSKCVLISSIYGGLCL